MRLGGNLHSQEEGGAIPANILGTVECVGDSRNGLMVRLSIATSRYRGKGADVVGREE